jgi:dimethylargininase
MLTAITRSVSPTIGDCELTFLSRQRIDFDKAARQQKAYEQSLTKLGVRVLSLPAEPEMPDAVFVEDTAVVVDEVAVIASMGAATRRQEVKSMADTLSRFRPLKFINESGTLEGGDKFRIGRTLYVGVSTRTNRAGIAQLSRILESFGYQVKTVEVKGCLHLTTGCTYIGRNTILANKSWVDTSAFEGFDIIDVSLTEPWAANALLVGGVVLFPSCFPKTRALLEERGFRVETTDISEHMKAEAGLTCMSIIFETDVLNQDQTAASLVT